MNLFFIIRFIHVITAVSWVGGIIIFSLVVFPSVRRSLPQELQKIFIKEAGVKFRRLGWIGFVVLIITGLYLLQNKWGLQEVWTMPHYGHIVMAKLTLITVMLVLTFIHDFILGPRVSLENKQWQRTLLLWLARLNLIIGILIVFFAQQFTL